MLMVHGGGCMVGGDSEACDPHARGPCGSAPEEHRRDPPTSVGFPECWYSWRHQIAAFRDTYDVVAMDMRYAGRKGSYRSVALVSKHQSLTYKGCFMRKEFAAGLLL